MISSLSSSSLSLPSPNTFFLSTQFTTYVLYTYTVGFEHPNTNISLVNLLKLLFLATLFSRSFRCFIWAWFQAFISRYQNLFPRITHCQPFFYTCVYFVFLCCFFLKPRSCSRCCENSVVYLLGLWNSQNSDQQSLWLCFWWEIC